MFYVNVESGLFVKTAENFENLPNSQKPVFVCNSVAVIDIMFLNSDKTPFDLTGGEIVLALDKNFFPETLSSSATGTIVDPSAGHVRFEANCRTDRFKENVKTDATTGKMEATFYPAGGGTEIVLLQDVAQMKSRVLNDQGAPETGDPDYYSAAQINAIMNAGDEYEFSSGDSWHSEQLESDIYMRSRNKSVGGEWSDSILIPSGKDGADGASDYCYIRYASNSDGADFSDTPSDSLKYRGEIHSNTEISDVTVDLFAGKWVKYIGDDGATGKQGEPGSVGITLCFIKSYDPETGKATVQEANDDWTENPEGIIHENVIVP